MTCNCERCGRVCVVAGRQNAMAKLIRKSLVPKGCCVDCAITSFVKTGPLAEVIGGRWSAEGFEVGTALRLPHVQKQFAAVFKAGGCGEVAGEIDWERVIANWDLPAPAGWDWAGELYLSAPKRRRRA